MFNKSVITTLLSLILGTVTTYSQSDWRVPTAQSIANYPDTSILHSEVAYLSDSLMQGRARGTKGHANAAFYIAGRLKNLGCTPINGSYSYSFMVSDSTDLGHNILGIMHCSTNPACQRYIIVGAHYDGIGIIDGQLYPGADANASGVTIMLQAAEFMHKQLKSGYTYNSNIIFVAFDSYTDGREGSRKLWQAIYRGRLKDGSRKIMPANIAMMIDLDQVGSNLAPVHNDRPDYLMAIGEFTLPTAAAKASLERCNKYYGTDLDICKSYYGSPAFTEAFYKLGDRKHFIRAGVPTMYFTSGIAPTTNKPEDTPESLDYDVFRRRVILISRFIEKNL